MPFRARSILAEAVSADVTGLTFRETRPRRLYTIPRAPKRHVPISSAPPTFRAQACQCRGQSHRATDCAKLHSSQLPDCANCNKPREENRHRTVEIPNKGDECYGSGCVEHHELSSFVPARPPNNERPLDDAQQTITRKCDDTDQSLTGRHGMSRKYWREPCGILEREPGFGNRRTGSRCCTPRSELGV